MAYLAFGEELENQGTGTGPKYTYTGKELDSSGLMYYGARYYDPALSRFITPDTVYDRGPQGLNRYSYALNNPVRYNDPSGHFINGPDDDENPAGYGTVTGSAEQIADGSATIHDDGIGKFNLSLNEFTAGGYVTFPADSARLASPYPYRKTNDTGLAILHVGASILCEPYDWGATFYGWGQGEFSYWDVAGLLPFIPAASMKYVDDVVEHVDDVVKHADETTSIMPYNKYVIGASDDLYDPQKLKPWEQTLDQWIDVDAYHAGDYGKAWDTNKEAIVRAMGEGRPIRDASPSYYRTGYINEERQFLEAHDWVRRKIGGDYYWLPPSK